MINQKNNFLSVQKSEIIEKIIFLKILLDKLLVFFSEKIYIFVNDYFRLKIFFV
jgi:hypothetical protein